MTLILHHNLHSPLANADAAQADIDSFADHRASLTARLDMLRGVIGGAAPETETVSLPYAGEGADVAPEAPAASDFSTFLAAATIDGDDAPAASGFNFM